MMFLGLILLILSAVFSNALELSPEEVYNVVISESIDDSPIPIASLSYQSNEWTFKDLEPSQDVQGKYCISLLNSQNSLIAPCFNYKELSSPLKLKVVLEVPSTESSSVDSISLMSSEDPGVGLLVRKTTFIQPPSLKVAEKPKLGLDGKPVPPSEQEKSFIQQNWMYIVPPLLIVMFMSG